MRLVLKLFTTLLNAAGVARGCGWQHLAVYINLATFYLIGLPISCFLGFKTNLQYKVNNIFKAHVGYVCSYIKENHLDSVQQFAFTSFANIFVLKMVCDI